MDARMAEALQLNTRLSAAGTDPHTTNGTQLGGISASPLVGSVGEAARGQDGQTHFRRD